MAEMPARLLATARRAAGLSQRELAARAGTSGATIAAYESGRKEPRLSTLRRLVAAAGHRLSVTVQLAGEHEVHAPLTSEDRRSLALHRAVLRRLLDDPAAVRAKARHNLATMRRTNDGSAATYFDVWEALLDGPFDELVAVLTGLDHAARDLRQVTPFAGVIPPRERWEIVRAHHRQETACSASNSST